MRYIWIILLVLSTTAVLLIPYVSGEGAHSSKGEELIIVSAHWDGIREEFGNAFEDYARGKLKKDVRVVWLDLGGGSEIRRYVEQRAAQVAWDQGQGIGADIYFGGGSFEHDGFIRNEKFVKGGLLEPHVLPPEIMKNISPDVFGMQFHEKENRWHASCLSGFGFVYSTLVLKRANLPPPKTWNDLGRPEFQGWISCGDPTKSGSLLQVMDILVQAGGWEKGWQNLAALMANARAFNEGGASVPRDVALGQAAVGPCIDFYAAAPVRRQGISHLEFVFPEGASIITPDPISIFKNALHKELAHQFVDFVMSEEGQKLWYLKRGAPGGPKKFDLERLPVYPKMYESNLPTFTTARPFKQGATMKYDGKKFGVRRVIFGDLMRCWLIDTHEDLYRAWAAVIKAGKAAEMAPELFEAPITEEALADIGKKLDTMSPTELNELRKGWMKDAQDRYAKIIQQVQP